MIQNSKNRIDLSKKNFCAQLVLSETSTDEWNKSLGYSYEIFDWCEEFYVFVKDVSL